jgi:hypothetical protein
MTSRQPVRPSQLRDLNFKAAVLSFLGAKGFNDVEAPHHAMTMTSVAASWLVIGDSGQAEAAARQALTLLG